jgi:hypothetical protein
MNLLIHGECVCGRIFGTLVLVENGVHFCCRGRDEPNQEGDKARNLIDEISFFDGRQAEPAFRGGRTPACEIEVDRFSGNDRARLPELDREALSGFLCPSRCG